MQALKHHLNLDELLHGSDYYPDQWQNRPDIIRRDFQLMDQANINTVTVGVFAWSMLEPEEGKFNFDWLDEVFDRMEARGGHVILATPSGARPAWLARKYPEVLRTDENGQQRLYGGRHNHCLTSPIYREKTRIIDEKLAERYGQRKGLLLWHISNEFSGECHCELCQVAFRQWLKDRYHTLDKLNAAWYTNFWSHRYDDWAEVIPPSPRGDIKLNGLNLDWKRFVSDQTLDFYQNEVAAVQKYSPNKPVTTNFMAEDGYLQPYAGLNYAKLAQKVDIIGWDCYPSWHNDQEDDYQVALRVAALNSYYYSLKQRPFMIMECTPSQLNWKPFNRPKKPGMHRLSALQLIGDGANGVMYFQMRQSLGASEQFHGAVIGHDGSSANRVFQEVAQVGNDLQELNGLQNSTRKAEVAIVYDVENFWALDDAYNFAASTKKYWQTIQTHFNSFVQQQIPVDIISPDADLSAYKLVVDPLHYMTSEQWLTKLSTYVKNGGAVVGTYLTGFVDEITKAHLGGWPQVLRDLYGIDIEETDTLYPSQKNALVYTGKTYQLRDYCTVVKPQGANVLAEYATDFYQGTPTLTVNQSGAGRAYYLAARSDEDFLMRFYHDVCVQCKITPIAEVTVPYGVVVQQRDYQGKHVTFILNFTHADQKWVLNIKAVDLLTGAAFEPGNYTLHADGVLVIEAQDEK